MTGFHVSSRCALALVRCGAARLPGSCLRRGVTPLGRHRHKALERAPQREELCRGGHLGHVTPGSSALQGPSRLHLPSERAT